MLLFSFPCLVTRQIIQVIFPLRFILSLTPMLIFALFFIWRLIWDVLKHFGWSQMNCVWLSFLGGNNRQHRPVCAKTISSWVRKVLCVAKAHVSRLPLGGCSCSSWCFLVSILQAGDWAQVSTPATTLLFPLYYYYGSALGLYIVCYAGPQWVGLLMVGVKHWLIFSHAHVGLSGHRSPQYWGNSSQSVCAVLALDSWKYCSGEQAQHLPLNVCLEWLHWLRGSGIPSATLWQGSLT